MSDQLDSKTPKFEPNKTYQTTSHLHVCLESKEKDCVFPDMVDLEPETILVFDGMDGETYRFHAEDGTEYRLHHKDVEYVGTEKVDYS